MKSLNRPTYLTPAGNEFEDKLAHLVDTLTSPGTSGAALEPPILTFFDILDRVAIEAPQSPGVAAEADSSLVAYLRPHLCKGSSPASRETMTPEAAILEALAEFSALSQGTYHQVDDRPISAFYTDWKARRTPDRGGDFCEYGTLIATLLPQIERSPLLTLTVKKRLLHQAALLLVDLGYNASTAVSLLDPVTPLPISGLLDLFVEQVAGRANPWDNQTGKKTARFWVAGNPLVQSLFIDWKTWEPIDFTGAPTPQELAAIQATDGAIFEEWDRGQAPRHLARLERIDAKGKVVDSASVPTREQLYRFASIKTILVGREEAGKSSFVQACRDLSERQSVRGGLRFQPDRGLQALAGSKSDQWKAGVPSKTDGLLTYAIDVQPERVGSMSGPISLPLCLCDTEGGKVGVPEHFDDLNREAIQTADGVIIVIDARDKFADVEDHRRQALWFGDVLHRLRTARADRRHFPITIAINHADQAVGVDVLRKTRPNVIPADDPLMLFAGGRGVGRLGNGPSARLSHAIAQDPATNFDPAVQMLIDRFVNIYAPLLEQVSQTTYRAQIFLTAAVKASNEKERTTLPRGVGETLSWIAHALYPSFLAQAPEAISREEGRLAEIQHRLTLATDRASAQDAHFVVSKRRGDRITDRQTRGIPVPLGGLRLKSAKGRESASATARDRALAEAEDIAELEPIAGARPEARLARLESAIVTIKIHRDELATWRADLKAVKVPTPPPSTFVPPAIPIPIEPTAPKVSRPTRQSRRSNNNSTTAVTATQANSNGFHKETPTS